MRWRTFMALATTWEDSHKVLDKITGWETARSIPVIIFTWAFVIACIYGGAMILDWVYVGKTKLN